MRIPVISLMFLVLFIIGLIMKPSMNRKKNELIEKGIIKGRDPVFLRQDHLFYSKKVKDVEEVFDELVKRNFKVPNVTDKSDYLNWSFKLYDEFIKFSFEAFFSEADFYFRKLGQESDGTYKYCFSLEDYHSKSSNISHISYSVAGDSILTIIEKILKDLDDDVEVERLNNDFSVY